MLKLWMVPKDLPLKKVSNQEYEWSLNLSQIKKREYLHSRGYIRLILGELLNIDPLHVGLIAPPSKPPILNKEIKSFISISHCIDFLFFGFSTFPIGLDIERIDRNFFSKKIVNRFFSENEKSFLNKLTPNEYSIETLKLWVSKEAAIKWDRGSLYKDITCWECDTESKNIINKKTKNKLNLSSFQLQNWYLSVASKEKYRSSDLTVCFY